MTERLSLDSSNCLMASEQIQIPFFDVDLAGIVWHGHYLKYFELARCALLEAIGYSYMAMRDSEFLWPIVDTNIRYINPLVLDQKVLVIAHLKEWELRLVIEYQVLDQDGAVCTRGRTVQVPVDVKTNSLQLGCPEILITNVDKCLDILSRERQSDD